MVHELGRKTFTESVKVLNNMKSETMIVKYLARIYETYALVK